MIQSRYRSSLCVLALISVCGLIPAPLRAADPVCDPKDPKKCAVSLKVGEPAPFAGQLLTPTLAIDLGQKADSFDKRLSLELGYKTRTLQIELDLERRLRKIDLDAFQRSETLLLTRLEEAHYRPWYEHPAFVSVVTAAILSLVFYGSIEVLRAI